MASIFQGDPLLSATGDGLTVTFKGGQPVMDNGLVNSVILSLFHDPWVFNAVIENPSQHIGSEFLFYLANKPITIANLNNARNIALKSLQWMLDEKIASEIDVRLQNPNGSVLQVLVLVKPPADTYIALLATRYGLNWKIQYEPYYPNI